MPFNAYATDGETEAQKYCIALTRPHSELDLICIWICTTLASLYVDTLNQQQLILSQFKPALK